MKYKILITGGLGILGNNLIQLIYKKNNYKIFLLDHKKNYYRFKKTVFKNKVKFIPGNFLKLNQVKILLKKYKFNFIIHLAAVTQVIDAYKGPMKTFNTNINGTINILESIRLINKNIKFIYASSDKAYGELVQKSYLENHQLKGVYPYDVSKSTSDLIAQSYSKTYNLNVGIIRCGNIFGPYDYNLDRLIPGVIVNSLKNKRTIIRSNGKLIRDYIYVIDAAKAYIKLMEKMKKKSKKLYVYNIGSKYNLSVSMMVNKILKIMNKNLNPIIKNTSKIEIKKQKLNYSKATKELKWIPKSDLNKSLLKTIKWYEKNIYLF